MTIVKSEFALALNQVATERGISVDDVIESIEAAILAAYKKEIGEQTGDVDTMVDDVVVKVSRENGEAHLYDVNKNDITPAGFGRIAAQTAKQVILQKIREVEKKTVLSQYESQVHTLIRGRMMRYDGYNGYADIGKIEALLPKDEQSRHEKYHVNSTYVFFIKEISEDRYGNSRIIISRTDPRLVEKLFEKEVPEIASGTVLVKKVAREAGDRAKIAVYSSQGGVDPVGACVGQKGVRVQTVTNELGADEKIDIIQWSADPAQFITAALSPAQVVSIEVDQNAMRAKVIVDEEQAPLAIGRGGVNVNLASRLTGYEIDIVQLKSEKPKAVELEKTVEEPPATTVEEQAPNAQESTESPSESEPSADDRSSIIEPESVNAAASESEASQ